jgi:DNA-binding NarL/FixJ family response regulator
LAAKPIRIVLIDDSPLYRGTIRNILEKQPNLQVVAEAENGSAGISLVDLMRPDVVLMDISMPILDGIEATRIISSKFPDTKVIVLTMHTDQTYSDTALQAGACQFLAKDCGKEKLLNAIKHCCLASEKLLAGSHLKLPKT